MLPRTRSRRLPVLKAGRPEQDEVALEEPLELQISAPDTPGFRLASILRTPGHDFELALGFLFGEGIVDHVRDVLQIRYCNAPQDYNVLHLELRSGRRAAERIRAFAVSSSCGACGRDLIETALDSEPLTCPAVSGDWLASLPPQLRQAQSLFSATGGTHGAALFPLGGPLELCYEDVGRHNAVDKLAGRLLQESRIPADGRLLLLSGRIGFELVQKALRCRIPAVAAMGAPTSLAVDLARRGGLFLAGFLSADRVNVYSGELE